MQRFITLVALVVASAVFAFADVPHASVVLVRNHHVRHHRAHKAGKHHAPKHRHNSI